MPPPMINDPIAQTINHYLHTIAGTTKIQGTGQPEDPNNIYLRIETTHQQTNLYTATAPGGAWYHYGTITHTNTTLTIKLKTINSIIKRKTQHTTHSIALADPNMFTKLEQLINTAATNATKAHRLEHKRTWSHWHRINRQRLAQTNHTYTPTHTAPDPSYFDPDPDQQ